MSTPQATTRHCYRCGKAQLEPGALRLLPGSTHITLCPDCYAVVWGWHEVLSTPAPDAQPREEHAEGEAHE